MDVMAMTGFIRLPRPGCLDTYRTWVRAAPRLPCIVAASNKNSGVLSCVVSAMTILHSNHALAAFQEGSSQCSGFGGDNMPTFVIVACIVQALALVGAAVGGTLARQRKQELEKVNAQLRQIFAKMRRQYQVENYAPALTYAPPAGMSTRSTSFDQEVVDSGKHELMMHLRAGKKFLREKNPKQAFIEFEKALDLSKQLQDSLEEKKAARGLGASCQRQGKFREAIKYHSMVLTISHISGEHSGDTEALGAIADCYTELGDLENAAKYYDLYIAKIDEE